MSLLQSIMGTSPESEKKSVEEHVADIDFGHDNLPCVFRAPKSLTGRKPEAYAPQKLGLGPYHHGSPDVYTMRRKKFDAVVKFLDADEKLHEDIDLVVQHLQQRDSLIRACYDEHLDHDRSTLARIVAIDAIYLLHYFEELEINPDVKKKLAADILMLENQIPLNFLFDIRRILKLSSRGRNDNALFKNVTSFCKEESPLEFIEKQNDQILRLMRQGHLLSVLYYLILPKSSTKSESDIHIGIDGESEIHDHHHDTEHLEAGMRRTSEKIKQFAGMLTATGVAPGANLFQKQLSAVESLPWHEIFDKLGKFNPYHKENSSVDEIDIPTAKKLSQVAGVKFAHTEGGIRNVRFEQRERKLYLPTITLHSNSEVILRNLLAYEAASVKPGSALELAEYVDMMCGIVDTPEDVELLRKEGIIVSALKSGEIVRIFNGIWRTTGDNKSEGKTNVREAIQKVNELYDSSAWVKAYKHFKKYLLVSLKVLGVLAGVMAFVLFVLQAFCVIYDCNKHWSMKGKFNPLQALQSRYVYDQTSYIKKLFMD